MPAGLDGVLAISAKPEREPRHHALRMGRLRALERLGLAEETVPGNWRIAGDIEPTRARVLYAVQQALASSAFTDVMGVPAWKSLPSWYLVAQNDEAIPPDAERQFAARMGATTVEIPSSHVAMVSHAAEVAELVEKAAEAVGAAVR